MAEAENPEGGRPFNEYELDWIGAHLTDLRRSVAERRIRSSMLWTGLVVGLVAHVTGFLLKSSVTGEPLGVLADLLYALGWALWTGVVVVSLVEIIPAAKERQISRALDVYEAAVRSRARTKGEPPQA
jgi:hypothetical protein